MRHYITPVLADEYSAAKTMSRITDDAARFFFQDFPGRLEFCIEASGYLAYLILIQ